MSESLRNQLLLELRYHEQESVRLRKCLTILDEDTGVPSLASASEPSVTARGVSPGDAVPLKVYKKRTQTPEARKRIGDFQRERHKKAREAKAAKEAESTAAGSVGRS
jgi:hypothetical protein